MNTQQTWTLAPGEARAPTASTQQIIHRDGRPVPKAYEEVRKPLDEEALVETSLIGARSMVNSQSARRHGPFWRA
jgi:hypothetical protein